MIEIAANKIEKGDFILVNDIIDKKDDNKHYFGEVSHVEIRPRLSKKVEDKIGELKNKIEELDTQIKTKKDIEEDLKETEQKLNDLILVRIYFKLDYYNFSENLSIRKQDTKIKIKQRNKG